MPRRIARNGLLALLCLIGGFSTAALGGPAEDYMLHCMGCHGSRAQGMPGKIPPLALSLEQFMRAPAGRNYVLRVPGAANSTLNDAQLAVVLNWIAGQFGSVTGMAAIAPFTAEEVTAARHSPLVSVKEVRRGVVATLAASGPAPSPDY